jgi:hypothetical protein
MKPLLLLLMLACISCTKIIDHYPEVHNGKYHGTVTITDDKNNTQRVTFLVETIQHTYRDSITVVIWTAPAYVVKAFHNTGNFYQIDEREYPPYTGFILTGDIEFIGNDLALDFMTINSFDGHTRYLGLLHKL